MIDFSYDPRKLPHYDDVFCMKEECNKKIDFTVFVK